MSSSTRGVRIFIYVALTIIGLAAVAVIVVLRPWGSSGDHSVLELQKALVELGAFAGKIAEVQTQHAERTGTTLGQEGGVDAARKHRQEVRQELEGLAASMSPLAKKMANALIRLQEAWYPALDGYEHAAARLDQTGGLFEVESLKTPELIDRRKEAIRAVMSANEDVIRAVGGTGEALRLELEPLGLPSAVVPAVAFMLNQRANLEQVRQMRTLENELCSAALEILDFLKQRHGIWHAVGPRVFLRTKEDEQEYNSILKRAELLTIKLRESQKSFLGIPP